MRNDVVDERGGRCRRSLVRLAVALAARGTLAIAAAPALAAPIAVTNTADSGPGSLRTAITAANLAPTRTRSRSPRMAPPKYKKLCLPKGSSKPRTHC